jgi:hypothetical protein
MRAALSTIAGLAAAIALGGCGGSEAAPVHATALEGVWEYELTYDYLVENGISIAQAEAESGAHTATLANGEFTDQWRTAENRTGSCSGVYTVEGATVTFHWSTGCFGDWQMSPEINGDEITWTDIQALPPYDDEEEKKVNEVFNSVPWTRSGDAPKS